MSLPDKHRTARFESLPQRLKAKAEAIINKKFGIDLKEKMDADGWDKDAIEAVAFKDEPKPITYIKLTPDDYSIYYRHERIDYEIETCCPKCEEDYYHHVPAIEAEMRSQGFTWFCNDCKAQLSVVITSKQFDDAYSFPRKKEASFRLGDICTIVDSQSPTWTGYRDGDTVTVISESRFGSYEVRRADDRYTQILHGEQLTLKSPW